LVAASKARLILASLFLLPILPQAPCAAAAQETWRVVSRQARIAIDHQDFERAEKGYILALKILQKSDPNSEALQDLKLLLAQAYCRDGKIQQCDEVLAQVEKTINATPPSDPLLVARYWRRRSELQARAGNLTAASESFRKALAVVRQCFGTDSKHYKDHWSGLIKRLVAAKQWTAVCTELQAVQSDGEPLYQLPRLLRESYTGALVLLERAAFESVKDGHLSDACLILAPLSSLDTNQDQLVRLWQTWVYGCFLHSQYPQAGAAIDSLNKLIQPMSNSSAPGHIESSIKLRTCLATIYWYQNKSEAALAQLKSISALIPSLDAQASAAETLIFCGKIQELVGSKIAMTPTTKENLLRLAVGASNLPASASQRPPSQELARFYLWSRCMLASQLDGRNALQEASSTISGIAPIAIEHSEHPELWKARIYVRLCSINQKMGNLNEARSKLTLASKCVEVIPTGPEKEDLLKRTAELSQLIEGSGKSQSPPPQSRINRNSVNTGAQQR
jgi:tetratricopeptide (TPR) repeat protein